MQPTKCAAISLIGLGILACAGCGKSGAANDEPLTWKHVDAALASADVHTIREFFARLSELPIEAKEKEGFADGAKWEAQFEPMADYLTQEEKNASIEEKMQGRDSAFIRAAVHKRLEKSMHWKTDSTTLDGIAREYLVYSEQATEVQRIVEWGKPVYFDIFTDEHGAIIGWTSTRDSHSSEDGN